MSNDYFNHNSPLVAGTSARADALNDIFDGIETADLLS